MGHCGVSAVLQGSALDLCEHSGEIRRAWPRWAEHWLVFTNSGKWLFCQLVFTAHVFCVLCYIPDYLNIFIVHVLYVLCYLPDHWCRSYREAGSREYQNWNLNQKFSSGTSRFPIPQGIWPGTFLQGMPYPVCAYDSLIERLVWDMGYFLTTSICFNMAA